MTESPPPPRSREKNDDRTPTGRTSYERIESVRPPATRADEGTRLALGVAATAMLGGAFIGVLVVASLAGMHVSDPEVLATVATTALATGLIAFVLVRNLHHRRFSRIVAFVEERIAHRTSPRLVPVFDDDELGRVIEAIQRLVASQAQSAVDPAQSQREQALEVTIAEQAEELARRVREQTLLFEVLRESTSTHDVKAVLDKITQKLGPALDLRHGAILLRSATGFSMAASWGQSDTLVGLEAALAVDRTDPKASDAPTSTELGRWLGKDDVSSSFTSIPLEVHEELVGLLIVGRSISRPLNDIEVRYLSALGSHVALAIHNAQLFEKLEELSTRDELTKLPNRRYFRDRLAREFADARRYGHTFSILMIDVDHFKKLNDREGHPVGDAALVRVAEVLSASLREVDTVARWGGEEFIVIVSHAADDAAREVGEKLRRGVYEIDEPWSRGQPGGHVTVSIGVAEAKAPEIEGGLDADLIQRADRAAYVAKRDGRNVVRSV